MRSSKGGHHPAVTTTSWSTATARGLPPEIWLRILAKGQSSTDLIHTKGNKGFWSFGHLPTRPRGGQIVGH